jgi:hypothetical protein
VDLWRGQVAAAPDWLGSGSSTVVGAGLDAIFFFVKTVL